MKISMWWVVYTDRNIWEFTSYRKARVCARAYKAGRPKLYIHINGHYLGGF